MTPADKGFKADNLAGNEIYLGLVVEDEFAPLKSESEIGAAGPGSSLFCRARLL